MLTKEIRKIILKRNREAFRALQEDHLEVRRQGRTGIPRNFEYEIDLYLKIYASLSDINNVLIELNELSDKYNAVMDIIAYSKDCKFCKHQRDCNQVKTVGECAQEWEFGLPENK